jgi:2'-5' RNA ligase
VKSRASFSTGTFPVKPPLPGLNGLLENLDQGSALRCLFCVVQLCKFRKYQAMRKRGLSPMTQKSVRPRLQKRYDHMWSAAVNKIRAGKVDLDPVLAARLPDRRRGLALMVRPSRETRRRVMKFLHELRRLEPDQHYYAPSELHLTILSPFTTTLNHRPFFARLKKYISAVDAALRRAGPMRIEFSGVTASPGAVLIQGFFADERLNHLRDDLRRELRARGLTAGLDARYRLETAHMTVMRFRAAPRDPKKFAAALTRARRRSFGSTTIRHPALVKTDWYMSRKTLETVKRYRLSAAARRIKPALRA